MRIYRVSGLRSAGSASIVARTISAINQDVSVKVDVESGLVAVKGRVSDYLIANAVQTSGCQYLGPLDDTIPTDII